MIVEFRTYTVRPRTLPAFLKSCGENLERRLTYSKLAAFWHTEFGPLNQVVQAWSYKNELERRQVQDQVIKDGVWPSDTSESIVEINSEIFDPVPLTPQLVPGEVGPYFEMRLYTLKPGSVPGMTEKWAEHLPGRVKLSPLVGLFARENMWMHIWAYNSLDERVDIRAKAISDRIWPPPGDSPVVRQETKLLRATSFSPIK
jgi:hypothetical protein